MLFFSRIYLKLYRTEKSTFMLKWVQLNMRNKKRIHIVNPINQVLIKLPPLIRELIDHTSISPVIPLG